MPLRCTLHGGVNAASDLPIFLNMKHLFLTIGVMATLMASAQTDCGYQPDVDPDWSIGVTDVLSILGLFGEVDTDQD